MLVCVFILEFVETWPVLSVGGGRTNSHQTVPRTQAAAPVRRPGATGAVPDADCRQMSGVVLVHWRTRSSAVIPWKNVTRSKGAGNGKCRVYLARNMNTNENRSGCFLFLSACREGMRRSANAGSVTDCIAAVGAVDWSGASCCRPSGLVFNPHQWPYVSQPLDRIVGCQQRVLGGRVEWQQLGQACRQPVRRVVVGSVPVPRRARLFDQ